MLHINILLFSMGLIISIPSSQAGMSCNVFGGSCPEMWSSENKEFCCPSVDGKSKCCTAEEFAKVIGAGIVLPVVLGIVSLVIIFICCICCICCKCCKRLEQGAVYGTRDPIRIIQVNTDPGPAYNPQQFYPPQAAGMPQPPPAYTSEAYTKQAPYNPTYNP